MTFTVRSGRPEDLESIAHWTRETFAWGDYVPDRYTQWLSEPDSEVLVCVGEDDVATALVHVLMLSDTEAWLEAARVHPDHKRQGMGKALNHAGMEWARQNGAQVVRLATEEENFTAKSQVESLGYRPGSIWVAGFLEPDRDYRAPPGQGLALSSSLDLDSAWISWSRGNLAATGRGLLNLGWQWRKATPADLENAIASRWLYQSSAGWVMFRPDTPDKLETVWLAASATDFPMLLRGILDHAASSRAEHLAIRMPAADWAVESLRREGFRIKEILVYYKAI